MALACLATGCHAPPPKPKVKHERTPLTRAVAIRTKGSLPLQAANGDLICTISGEVRTEVAERDTAFELADATVASAPPQVPVTATAGRVRYAVGDTEVDFDHRLFVKSPTRHARLEAERARFSLETRRFSVAQRARAAYAGTLLEGDHVTADFDLRTLSADHLAALATRGAGETWTATSLRGKVDAQRQVHFETVKGTLRQGGRETHFEAPRALWKTSNETLDLDGGVTFRSAALTVHADGATWLRRERRIVTRGATTAEQAGMRAAGRGARIDLTSGTATVLAVRVEAKGGALNADSGRMEVDGRVTLHGLRGELPGGGTARAEEAVYNDRERRLVLTRGGEAQRGEATVAADRVVWDGGTKRITASGSVRLRQPGLVVRGDELTAPDDLRSARLTDVAAHGEAGAQHWDLNADRADWTRERTELTHPKGTFFARERTVDGTAGRAVYLPAKREVHLADGFEARGRADEVWVKADRAVYDVAGGVFRASGNVAARLRGVSVQDRQWTYYVGGDPHGVVGRGGGTRSPAEKEPRP
ncbi:MAG: hypothetical protein HYU66_10005 [Armatimonadetes bacterium]|nr:hypothetical protein [Armatimonadota bacterium]